MHFRGSREAENCRRRCDDKPDHAGASASVTSQRQVTEGAPEDLLQGSLTRCSKFLAGLLSPVGSISLLPFLSVFRACVSSYFCWEAFVIEPYGRLPNLLARRPPAGQHCPTQFFPPPSLEQRFAPRCGVWGTVCGNWFRPLMKL